MVGIVIVSHSAKLASGVRELATQMVQGEVKIAIAAGMDDPENPFGTDVMQVHQAIESVFSDDGVVVLMDLGSAVLSAEMALEFLSEERREKVRLCEAPLVEGTIAAVVQAANGAKIDRVLAEARGALAAKAAQLSPAMINSASDRYLGEITKEINLSVQNNMGLHARPAAKFVATAAKFTAEITVKNINNSNNIVNGKSINQLITLGVRQGDRIAIAASGSDADAALAALQDLVENQFGETAENLAAMPCPKVPFFADALAGIPVSPGIAIGKVFLYQPVVVETKEEQVENPQTEWQHLQLAIEIARNEIQALRDRAFLQAGEAEAVIFDAHLLWLEDPDILEATRQRIFDYTIHAASAWKIVIDKTIRNYKSLPDPYLQARSTDIRDVGQRVLKLLTGASTPTLDLPEPKILVTSDLTPSEITQLDGKKVLGICTILGSNNSHCAILARSLGIPTVMGVGMGLLHLENDTSIALDGDTGQVWVNPDEARLKELQIKLDNQLTARQESQAIARRSAITIDGHQIRVMANIVGIVDAKIAANNGAEGIGLLRSELLYLNRITPPTEEEQFHIYENIAEIISPYPLIIRTLDIGGDKRVSYLNLREERNPFLGWRGIRLLLDLPDLFKIQLKAILRVSANYKVKILLPMIASIGEIRATKEIVDRAKLELQETGIPFDDRIEIGIMVEVPSAAIMADKLAVEVDFFSIGTNDLSQYIMASDRTNPKVAKIADPFEPAVLRSIAQTVQAARNANIWVGVCGELASYPEATPILVGLGVDELSMAPPAIPAIKAAICEINQQEAEAIASAVLQLDSSESVRQFMANRW